MSAVWPYIKRVVNAFAYAFTILFLVAATGSVPAFLGAAVAFLVSAFAVAWAMHWYDNTLKGGRQA